MVLRHWITGISRSGKTTQLVEHFQTWVKAQPTTKELKPSVLVLAANDDNKKDLTNLLTQAIRGSYPLICKTPLGWMGDEVKLFWPLIFEQLNLKAQFCLRLRPETEQDLASRLWEGQWEQEELLLMGGEPRLVRRTLDLLQLAGAGGVPIADIPQILAAGWGEQWEMEGNPEVWQALTVKMGRLIEQWRNYCLERGFLTYGITYELYWRYLLPHPEYDRHLHRRIGAIFADDVDDYPAIARDLLELLLDHDLPGVFTFNPQGKVRLGLNGDPDYGEGLARRCTVTELNAWPNLANVINPIAIAQQTQEPWPREHLVSIQTTARAELLRQVCQVIIDAVKRDRLLSPNDIVIIAPGLDEIARYSLTEILQGQGLELRLLNEQRPLISSPLVRGLLTLLGLVYRGLGQLISQEDVAEMLVVLSPRDTTDNPLIDPVRAGLLADYCYFMDLFDPSLLPPEKFDRWDRLGHGAHQAYQELRGWLEGIKTQLATIPVNFGPSVVLTKAIEHFFPHGRGLSVAQLAALRELMETIHHYWEVDRRIRQNEVLEDSGSKTVGNLIRLLREGTITANPQPLSNFEQPTPAITLTNIFQYRAWRQSHRWQFWLDAGSTYWEQGGTSVLYGAPLFLKQNLGRSWTMEQDLQLDRDRLDRILWDLPARAEEKIFLCHSDLGVNGSEQTGALLSLVYNSQAWEGHRR